MLARKLGNLFVSSPSPEATLPHTDALAQCPRTLLHFPLMVLGCVSHCLFVSELGTVSAVRVVHLSLDHACSLCCIALSVLCCVYNK